MLRPALALGLMLGLCTNAGAEVLITPEEAARPPAAVSAPPEPLETRAGVSARPDVTLELPAVAGKSPLHFRVKFKPHNGADIDPNSVRVIYLKTPVVNLTPRVKAFTERTGIDMPMAEVPPGEHLIMIEITDTYGHKSRPSAPIRLNVQR
jgi:hypothetical protein